MTQPQLAWRQSIRLSLSVIPPAWRKRWIGLILISVVNSLLETVAAIAVLWLIQMMINPGGVAIARFQPALNRVAAAFGSSDPVLVLAVGVALFYAVKSLASAYASYRQAYVALVSGAEFARALFAAYLYAPYAYHLHKNSAEIQRNVGAAVDAVFYDILFSLVGLGSELLIIVALVGVTFFVAPLTTVLVVTALTIMTGLIYWLTQQRIYRWGAEAQALGKTIIMTVDQGIEGLKEIKLLGREPYFIKQFDRDRRRRAVLHARRLTTLQLPRLALETLFVALIAIVLIASKFTLEASGGVLPLLGLYAYTGFRVMPSVARMLSYMQNIRFGSATLQDVESDFATLTRAQDATGPAATEDLAFAAEIRLRCVSFTYDGAAAETLSEIDFAVRRGESVGIVGSTGAGKSTLLDLIAGLYEPSSGDILIDETSLRGRASRWQRRIGYVPQTVFLVDDTVRCNIALGVADDEIDDRRIAEVARIAQLDEVIAGLPSGIDTVVGQRGVRLSGGQRQRIAIARALYHRPDVLLLDEATAALDNRTEQYLSTAVQGLSGTMTLVIVAHRLETIRSCDRILVMRKGAIVDRGTYDHLLAHSDTFRHLAAHAEGGVAD